MRALLVARNELAIVTKSIAFALSPRGAVTVGSLKARRGGTVIWARRVKQHIQ